MLVLVCLFLFYSLLYKWVAFYHQTRARYWDGEINMIAFFKDLVEQERKPGICIEKQAEMLQSLWAGSTGGSGHYNWEMLGVPPRVKTYV